MTNMRTLIATAALLGTAPAFAQAHNHAGMQHDHGAMNHNHGGKPAARPAGPSAAQAGPGATVKINGLICDFCVQALTKTFKRQPAVRAIAVDLNAKELRLGFKPNQSLDNATITKLVRDAGYNVVGITRRAS